MSPLPHRMPFQVGELLAPQCSKSSLQGQCGPALHSWTRATAEPYQSRRQPSHFGSSWVSRTWGCVHPRTQNVIPCGHAPPGASSSGNSVHPLFLGLVWSSSCVARGSARSEEGCSPPCCPMSGSCVAGVHLQQLHLRGVIVASWRLSSTGWFVSWRGWRLWVVLHAEQMQPRGL